MAKEHNLFYKTNPINFDNARKLRKQMTESESILWGILRGRKFLGLKFRRQHPIKEYIADFYCHERKIVIELDGGYHKLNDQKTMDGIRSDAINSEGIRVVRFTNEDIIFDIDSSLKKLEQLINDKNPLSS